MMSLFKAELLKTKNSKTLMSLALVIFIWILISFYSFYTIDYKDFSQSRYPVEDKNPWFALFFEGSILLLFVLLPLLSFIIVLSVKMIEDKADGWKRLFVLPSAIFSLHFIKLVVIWLYCLAFVFNFFLLYYLSGVCLSKLKPDFLFAKYDKYDFYLLVFSIKSMYATLVLSSIAYALLIIIRKFSISLIVSVLIPILGLLLFDKSIFNPFTYLLRSHSSFLLSRKNYFELHKTFDGFTYGYLNSHDLIGAFLIIVSLSAIFILSKKPIIKYE